MSKAEMKVFFNYEFNRIKKSVNSDHDSTSFKIFLLFTSRLAHLFLLNFRGIHIFNSCFLKYSIRKIKLFYKSNHEILISKCLEIYRSPIFFIILF